MEIYYVVNEFFLMLDVGYFVQQNKRKTHKVISKFPTEKINQLCSLVSLNQRMLLTAF